MPLPSQPVTLTVEQIADLNGKLSTMRHDINNKLMMIVASVEVIRLKPEMAERRMETLMEQPTKITAILQTYSAEFERALGITRP